MKSTSRLIYSVLICLLAGVIGSIFTTSSIPTWYAALNKPFFNPPNWIFMPVWTTLYVLMGISLYLIWIKKNKTAIKLFAAQLIFNVSWSVVFFGIREVFIAFVIIIILWVLILMTMIKSYKTLKAAMWLLLPYLLWVSFAAILNLAIVLLN